MPRKSKERKSTETVGVTLRLREALRGRLEMAAKQNDVSLNAEILNRLEASFVEREKILLVERLLGREIELELHLAIARMMPVTKDRWRTDRVMSHAFAGAISKIIKVFAGELSPSERNFPDRGVKDSADYLAWLAILTGRFHLGLELQLLRGKLS